ncbi:ribosome silencing factor [uncultured Bartonella sp.]|uniref:ribosome silencing factor n=1 Tax=uncultured Bartonella sp. TaxID=104108 RepID=UPI0025E3EDA2|nr:ribosome silencing factor [uncultured Bartonella sp.]
MALIVQKNLHCILSSLEESKAEDVVTIDIRGKSPLADYMVIASGRSQRHVSALADHLLFALKDREAVYAKVEGLSEGDWVLIDIGDIIVHLFRPETRDFYNLEKMWCNPVESLPIPASAGGK